MSAPPLPGPSRSVTVVFSRLGPYHLARLRGAAEVLARERVGLSAIAIAGMDKVYAWDPVDAPEGCPTRVLFPDRDYEDVSAGGMARSIIAALNEIDPLAVALPGWAFTEARAGLQWCRARERSAILMSESSQADHFRLWPREVMKRAMVRRFGAAIVGGIRHKDYARALGIPRAAIFGGYDVIDNEYFIAGAERARRDIAAVRAARGLPQRYILTSSRFIEKKNIDGLLQGYAQYAAHAANPPDLVVCGDGPLRDKLHRLARDLGLDGRVHWPGFVQYPDLPDYYAPAAAFILASTTEQWGLVVNEAMASGLPVLVSSRCGCSPELVHEGENGFTFDPFDVTAIAAALARIPADENTCAAMGAASRRIIAGFGPLAFGTGLLAAARTALARIGREDFGPPGSEA